MSDRRTLTVRGRVLRPLARVLLVLAGAVAGVLVGWLLATGTAAAAEPADSPREPLAGLTGTATTAVDGLTGALKPAGSVVRSDNVEPVRLDTSSLTGPETPVELPLRVGKTLRQGVGDLAQKVRTPVERVVPVSTTLRTSSILPQLNPDFSVPRSAAPGHLDRTVAPVRTGGGAAPADAPARPAAVDVAAEELIGELSTPPAPRPERPAPHPVPSAPISPATVPAPCSCGHDGSGSLGGAPHAAQLAGSTPLAAVGRGFMNPSAQGLAAERVEQPGVTPD
ncbi:hypothetical protein GCM10012275_41760 [Longimycelium tulufanense]|uniref:Uncharacterized protein n=1 Tax=Longimycelium tulufanense TaxID=907463 RepID=A0A8J3CHC5_9PSEU|nr:hypothetical protein [Longimycelium tulufanense]GGM66945.1 hypothetical protein GCM10012275_41760 [Longimycelium tulufanense]